MQIARTHDIRCTCLISNACNEMHKSFLLLSHVAPAHNYRYNSLCSWLPWVLYAGNFIAPLQTIPTFCAQSSYSLRFLWTRACVSSTWACRENGRSVCVAHIRCARRCTLSSTMIESKLENAFVFLSNPLLCASKRRLISPFCSSNIQFPYMYGNELCFNLIHVPIWICCFLRMHCLAIETKWSVVLETMSMLSFPMN